MWEGDRADLSRAQGPEGTVRDAMSPQDGGREGWVLKRMAISQDICRDAVAQNDAGGSLAEAEAGMAEMSARFRAGGGVVEVKV